MHFTRQTETVRFGLVAIVTGCVVDDEAEFRLTREVLASGMLQKLVAERSPGLRILTDDERERSLDDTLAARPAGSGDDGTWLFAYGSLIWNPVIRFDSRRIATIEGWHRAFCLSTPHGRGSVENPGLLLGLDRGGHCVGCAFRIPAADAREELSLLWRREMLSGSYIPLWTPLRAEDDAVFGHGITFTIDRACANYAGDVGAAERARRLATARGLLGSSADYLFQTRDGLRALGIPDPDLEDIASEVEHLAAMHRAQ